MAKKIRSLEPTPIMMLSMMALFVMMIPLYSMLSSKYKVRPTSAKESNVMVPAATPTPSPIPLY